MISYEKFIEKWKDKFEEITPNKFKSKSFYISFTQIYDATRKQANDIKELKDILNNNNDDEINEIHNSFMSYIFGDGKDYQATFEGNGGNWFIDWGEIKIEEEQERINYNNVLFYLGEKYWFKLYLSLK